VHKVVGKTVVIVDQQQHWRIQCSKGRQTPLYSQAHTCSGLPVSVKGGRACAQG
jgi:hypothetical protein